MNVLTNIKAVRQTVNDSRRRGKTVVLVPTMGNLHAGHLALIEAAQTACDMTVASVFVNELQFGPNEDFNTYPRTLEQDLQLLQAHGVDLVFTPSAVDLYPDGLDQHSRVVVPGLKERHCGLSRPHFFDGVTTVVCKLFHIIQPDVAVFGRKDYQQLRCIQQMVRDLAFPIEILAVATQRATDGLALSSRNTYLTPVERQLAPTLYKTLQLTKQRLLSGQKHFSILEQEAASRLRAGSFKPDYYHICHAQTLAPAQQNDQELVILAAAHLGSTRLIDNCLLQV